MTRILEYILSLFMTEYPDPLALTMDDLNDKALKLYGVDELFEEYEGELIYNVFDLLHVLSEAELISMNNSALVLCFDNVFQGLIHDNQELVECDLSSLVIMHLSNNLYGVSRWVCIKRQMKPCLDIRCQMKFDGYWDSELENLPKNIYD